MAAWNYPETGGYRPLPTINLACSGQPVSSKKEDWMALLDKESKSCDFFEALYEQFNKAPILGSLIDLEEVCKTGASFGWDLKDLELILSKAIEKERKTKNFEIAIAAQGMAKAASILSEKYNLIATNVPYLSASKQSSDLKGYCEQNFPVAKRDLATVFLDRSLGFCTQGGTIAAVTPGNWLFLSSYKNFRINHLDNNSLLTVANLGFHSFETFSGWDMNIILIVISKGLTEEKNNTHNSKLRISVKTNFLDASEFKDVTLKAKCLMESNIISIEQREQLKNPDAVIGLAEKSDLPLLSGFAKGLTGIQAGDEPHFERQFWELPEITNDWVLWQSTAGKTSHFGGKDHILWFGDDLITASKNKSAYIRSKEAWGKSGLVINQMGNLKCSIHTGAVHDPNCAIVLPSDSGYLPAMYCFCSSPEYTFAVRKINQKLNVTNATLVKVPFDLNHWTKVSKEKYPNGLPEPYSNDPTQWIFHGHPCGSVVWDEQKKRTALGALRIDDTVLHVAVARLLGYKWPTELDKNLELADEQRELVKRCETLEDYIDKGGILCLPPMKGERAAAERLRDILEASYGNDWSAKVLSKLLKSVGYSNKSLESWLRDGFFSGHLNLFKKRPFIWQIWDGLNDGFSALVNYHKLDYKLLETLIYTYLGDWINLQKSSIKDNVAGSKERLNAAESLQNQLKMILKGEKPYDIFVRWKSLKKQPHGWNPDLNDGVRLNIRPFMTPPNIGREGSGVLRCKPNINWKKDKGKELEYSPWFHLHKEDRINDCHLKLQEKESSSD
jgi:hypothetical protein